MTMPRLAVMFLAAVAPTLHAADPDIPRGSVRESHNVSVGERQETWQLRWTGPRQPLCAPAEPATYTCPCDAFSYGEEGPLVLVRLQGDKEIDRLELAPLFDESESPRSRVGVAALRRRPRQEGDREGDAALASEVAKRVPSVAMKLADYHLDGGAHAFVLPTESGPCGHMAGVLIGLAGEPPKLRAFGSESQPDKPLQLPLSAWHSLLLPTPNHRITVWTCGDHGSETETEIEITPSPHGFRVIEREFA